MADERVNRIVRIAIVAAVAVGAIYAAFYLLSGWYYDDKATAARMPVDVIAREATRFAFLVLSIAVAAAVIAVAISPHKIGHLVAAILGGWNAVAGIIALARGLTPVLGVALVIGGGTMIALAYFSFYKRSRAAWAFLASICIVFGISLLFGAPKTALQVGVSLWTALIFPAVYFVIVSALMMVRGEYRDP